MTPKSHKFIKAVTTIHDATPVRVSLVKHGANQTPWHALKSAKSQPDDSLMKIKPTQPDGAVHGIKFAADVTIQRVEFSAADFADTNAAKSYLEVAFDDVPEISTKEGGGFIATAVAEDTLTGISPVEAGKGVTFFVGIPKQPAAKSEDSAPPAEPPADNQSEPPAPAEPPAPVEPPAQPPAEPPAPEKEGKSDTPVLSIKANDGTSLSAKFSYYASEMSRGMSLADVVAAATADGLPLGYEQLMYSFEQAAANCIKAADYGALSSLCSELGSALTTLSQITAVAAAKGEDIAAIGFKEKSTKSASTEDTSGQLIASLQASVKALTALTARMDTLEKERAAKSDVTPLKQTVEALEKRLKAFESLRQIPGSADHTDVVPQPADASKTTKTGTGSLSKLEKNLAGIRDDSQRPKQ